MDTKKVLGSKTVWLAIIQALAGILVAVYSVDPAVASIGWVAIVKSGLDIGLRYLTTQPLA